MARKLAFSLVLALLATVAVRGLLAADEGGAADPARATTAPAVLTTKEAAAREAFLATQPSWLRPEPTTQIASAERAATRPSPNVRPATRPGTKPVEKIKRVVVISIDGLRPDLLLLADAPNARKLMAGGCYSMWAQTTPQSITLPSHISMLCGMTPNRHGILWNSDIPLDYPLFPAVPTLFEAAKRHGYTTAIVAGKDKFDIFDRPGVLDWRWIPTRGTVKTPAVAAAAVTMIEQHRPEVMLVHFPSVDSVGHDKGWGTPDQLKAIEEADKMLGKVLDALRAATVLDETLVIISADHGGGGKHHGPDDPRSRHIPWIASGPGLRKGYDLTTIAKVPIKTEDTFATACWALGIPPTVADLDGVPVKMIVKPDEGEELLKGNASSSGKKQPPTW